MKIALAQTDEEVAACYAVMREICPRLDAGAFLAAVTRMRAEGYQLVYLADPDVRSVAGFRKLELLATGAVLYVDDLVTSVEHRSRGYGGQLVAWLREEARRLQCDYFQLDAGLRRGEAHRFYERQGLGKVAFHFSMPV